MLVFEVSARSILSTAYTMSAPVADCRAVSLIKPIEKLRTDTRRLGVSDGLRFPIQTSKSVHVSDFRNVAVQCVGSQLGRHVTTRSPSRQIRANSSSVSTDSGSATPSSEVRWFYERIHTWTVSKRSEWLCWLSTSPQVVLNLIVYTYTYIHKLM